MSRQDYIIRINRVIDYIENHMSEDLGLEKLAGIAAFSPYHFHRIFSAFMNEPLNRFIRRVKIEKAAHILAATENSITEIALDCGFGSSAVFARSFKEFYNLSASEWRRTKKSKNRKSNSKNSEDSNSGKIYPLNHTITQERINIMKVEAKQVRVENLEEMTVAYVRHIGPYAGDEKLFENLFNKLFTWAGARDLLHFPETKVISVYHDDPNLTDEDKLRTSICITVPEETEVGGEVGKMKIKAGKYAMAEFELNSDQFGCAWNWLCGEWLPDSGYEAADGLSFEVSKNDPHEHPQGKHIVDICIPVTPA
jgi:AraC family transcriptional regulator